MKLYHDIQNIPGHVLVDEILRACLSGLLESDGLDEIYWISFTYVKLPILLHQLCASSSPQLITTDDVVNGLDMLLSHYVMLDKTERKLNE